MIRFKPKRKSIKKTTAYDEKYLWPIFSLFIRFRDTDENGYGKCFTCGLIKHWKDSQAGHYISRKNHSTKYNEVGVRNQCGGCNAPYIGGGRPEEFAKGLDELFGEGTATKLKIASKQTCKRAQFEYDTMADYYCGEVIKLGKLKGIDATELPAIKRWLNRRKN